MRGDGSAANQVDIITGCPSCVGGGSGEEVATSDGNTGNCGLAPAPPPVTLCSSAGTHPYTDIGASFQSCFWTY